MSISKEEIVHNALILLDENGLEGVTLRRLATRLKIKAPSLYWYFKNKQELLDEMASALIDAVARNNPPKESWEETTRRIADEVREAFLAHRDGAKVFSGTYPTSDNIFRFSDVMMKQLVNAGFDEKISYFFLFSFMNFITGFVIEEQALIEQIKRYDGFNISEELMKKYLSTTYALLLFSGEDIDERFSFGVELHIRALKTFY